MSQFPETRRAWARLKLAIAGWLVISAGRNHVYLNSPYRQQEYLNQVIEMSDAIKRFREMYFMPEGK